GSYRRRGRRRGPTAPPNRTSPAPPPPRIASHGSWRIGRRSRSAVRPGTRRLHNASLLDRLALGAIRPARAGGLGGEGLTSGRYDNFPRLLLLQLQAPRQVSANLPAGRQKSLAGRLPRGL